VVAALVPSHWVLDLVVHVPDLPLTPGGSARFGLGLWNWPVATMVVEAIVFFAGLLIYARATSARDRIGRYGFWSLAAFLIVLYVASTYGPPPTTVKGLALAALIGRGGLIGIALRHPDAQRVQRSAGYKIRRAATKYATNQSPPELRSV